MLILLRFYILAPRIYKLALAKPLLGFKKFTIPVSIETYTNIDNAK